MARDLVLDVVARKNSKDLILLAQEFETLAHEIDGANKSAQANVTFSKFLDDQISETKKQVQQLAQEFDKTGNADLFARLRGAQTNLTNLTRLRKQVIDFNQAQKESTQELEGTEAVLQRLSTDYFKLTQDGLAPARAEFQQLTDRQKTQAETVKILEQRYRETGKALDGLDLRRARTDLERLDEEVKTSADSLVNLERAGTSGIGGLVKEVENLGRSLIGLKESGPKPKDLSFSDFVKSETIKARNEVEKLRADLSRGGGVNVFGDLRKAEGDLKVLEEIGKDLTKTVADGITAGGKEGFKNASAASQGALSNPQAGPIIVGGIVAALVAGSPAIGAALSGVLLAGVGVAGIGAAVVGQLHDPSVQTAFSDLKSTAMGALTESTKSFAPLLVAGANQFQNAIIKAEPTLEKAFDKLAPHAQAVFTGIEGLAKAAAPGFLKGLDAAGPLLDELGRDLPGLGKAFSDFFSAVAGGAGGARDGLHSLFALVEGGVTGLGYILEGLSKGYEVLAGLGDLLTGDVGSAGARFDEVFNGTKHAKDGTDGFAEALKNLKPPAKDAAAALQDLNTQIDNYINKNLSADQAAVRQKQTLADLSTAIAQNGHNWDINTEAGRKNQGALLQAIQAAEQKRQADIANGKDAVQAANDYNQEVDALLGIAGKAGDAKTQLDALKGKYEIDVQEYYTTHFVNEGTPPSQFFHGLASGGPVVAGQPYIVGENGPELFMSDTAGQILPNDKLKKLQNLSQPPPAFRAASAASPGTTVTFAGDTSSAFATAFMYLVRTGAIQLH